MGIPPKEQRPSWRVVIPRRFASAYKRVLCLLSYMLGPIWKKMYAKVILGRGVTSRTCGWDLAQSHISTSPHLNISTAYCKECLPVLVSTVAKLSFPSEVSVARSAARSEKTITEETDILRGDGLILWCARVSSPQGPPTHRVADATQKIWHLIHTQVLCVRTRAIYSHQDTIEVSPRRQQHTTRDAKVPAKLKVPPRRKLDDTRTRPFVHVMFRLPARFYPFGCPSSL